MTANATAGIGRRVLGLAAGAAVLDWLTKVVASTTLDNGPIEVGSLITLRLSHNSGVAFGLGDSLPGPLLIALTGLVTIALTFVAVRGALGPWWVGGLVLGGAFANVADRALGGTVVDFLDLGWWPSFNLADVWITGGALLLVLVSLRQPSVSAA